MLLTNLLLSPILSNKIPYKHLYKKSHSYSHLSVCGCLYFATNLHFTHKLDVWAHFFIFLRYSSGQKRISSIQFDRKKMITFWDAIFYIDNFPYYIISNDDKISILILWRPIDINIDISMDSRSDFANSQIHLALTNSNLDLTNLSISPHH